MTARGCGHCAHSRGNGIMGSGPHFMKPTVIDEFLSINNNFSFWNIHFDNMSGKRNIIREISKFTKDKDVITEEMWAIEGEETRYLRITANTKTKKMTQTGKDNINIKWLDFVESKVPVNLENYTYYYPCFMITKTDNWVDSLKNKTELYALTNAGKTRKDQSGKVFLDKDGKSFNERMVDPKDLIRDVAAGKIVIQPHIVDSKPEPPKKETKETVEPPKKEIQKSKKVLPKTRTDYIIRQY